jgi:hypothetical protein
MSTCRCEQALPFSEPSLRVIHLFFEDWTVPMWLPYEAIANCLRIGMRHSASAERLRMLWHCA